MIHRDDFSDHGDVLPGIQKYLDLRQLDAKDGRRFGVESRAIDNGILIPLLELDHHLDALLLSHGANAEDRRDVNEPDTTNLHEVTLQLVTAADEDVVAAARHDHEIIGNEPVPALHEIEHALGL